jgi:hypothetical protein
MNLLKPFGFRSATALGILAVVAVAAAPHAQSPSALESELRRIFQSGDYAGRTPGPAVWVGRGASYAALERADGGDAREIVAYDTASGRREVLGQTGPC